MTTLTLYGNRRSGHSYKVRLALMLADLSHDYRHIDLSLPRHERPADFQAISRWQQVPVLMVGDVPLVQSNAILEWLAENEGVLAGAPGERQTIREWLYWEASRLGIYLPQLRRLRRPGADAGAELLDWLEQQVRADLATLNGQLSHRSWLAGQNATVADIAASGYLWWLHDAGLDIAEWPHIGAWLQRLSALPGWQHPDQLMSPDIPE